MMRRYVSTDIPEIREFFKEDPHLLIRLEAGLQALDLLYFDIWVAGDEQDAVQGVLFRSYGDFYLRLTPQADLQEVSAFLGFMPMLYSLSGEESVMQELLPMLQRVRSTTICTVARQAQPPEPLSFRLIFDKTERTEDFRMVYALLGRAGEDELGRFEDYYFTRRGLQANQNGRTYFLSLDGEAYSAVSTTGEADGMALITDVVTDARYRRQGLGSALLTQLCVDLHAQGLTPYVTYFASQAEHFYQHRGFEPCGQFIYARFDPPGEEEK